jgi:ATP-binding cassette subfamily B protein
LNHINLLVNPGETLAILGATGSGKTALIGLIPRFYEFTNGSVLMDGVVVRTYKQAELRVKIAVALQRSELFSRTIRENIEWGYPGATDDEIQAAAETALASGFIEAAAGGYGAVVAERGKSSGSPSPARSSRTAWS